MSFLHILVNILIFLLCLTFIVCVHEAGHLLTAKLFHVYCFEYSIGFGPKIFSHRFLHRKKKGKPFHGTPVFDAEEMERKEKEEQEKNPDAKAVKEQAGALPLDALKEEAPAKPEKVKQYHLKDTDRYNYYLGETALSLRVLPLGGYVSMAGEDEDDEGEIKVPKNRTLKSLPFYKQIVIMLAGITMNFILAILLFQINFGLLPQKAGDYSSTKIQVSEKLNSKTTPAYASGMRTGDQILTLYQEYHLSDEKGRNAVRYFPVGWEEKENRPTLDSYLSYTEGAEEENADSYSHTSVAYAVQDVIARNMSAVETGQISVIEEFASLHAEADSFRLVYITYQTPEGEKKNAKLKLGTEKNESDEGNFYTFRKLGITNSVYTYRYSAGEAMSLSFKEFGYLFKAIYQAIGSIFTPSGWSQMGGIISVYRVSEAGVSSGSFSYFLTLWAYISINLGCFNLLPFPGLDGWQTLLALIEGIIRKKIPTRFKGIANIVGLIIMFALAAVLLVKDIVHPLI